MAIIVDFPQAEGTGRLNDTIDLRNFRSRTIGRCPLTSDNVRVLRATEREIFENNYQKVPYESSGKEVNLYAIRELVKMSLEI